MVLVDIKSMGIDLSPPKRSQKTFGWRTAALARERAIEKMSKAATPAAVKKNLSVDDRIAARKQRTIASLGPKVAAAVLRRQAAGMFCSHLIFLFFAFTFRLISSRRCTFILTIVIISMSLYVVVAPHVVVVVALHVVVAPYVVFTLMSLLHARACSCPESCFNVMALHHR